jgi:hypothetical protein
MKDGNWIPLSKGLAKYLPKDRPYTKLEAAFSLQLDYDANNPVTVAGYSALWRWSRNRVRNFLDKIAVDIIYPKNTKKRQNQKGQIAIQIMDRSGEKKGQIRLINSKGLCAQKDRSGQKKGQIMDRYRSTTSYPDPNPSNSCQKTDKNPCPYDQILDLYHSILAELPRVRKFTQRRRKMLLAQWSEKARSERSGLYSNTLEFWEAFFKYISRSDFLMGRKTDFRANFEWIVTKKNFNKIIEGTYHSG